MAEAGGVACMTKHMVGFYECVCSAYALATAAEIAVVFDLYVEDDIYDKKLE